MIDDILLKQNEQLEDLNRNNYFIIQSEQAFRFGCDAVLLSDFIKVKKHETFLDIGTGTGIIPILLTAKTKGLKFFGIEILKDSADMAQRSVKLNKLEHKITIINCDVKKMSEFFKKSSFDVIASNPPYIKHNGGIINESEALATARHEIACNLDDIINQASIHLKTNGRFYMIHRPNRLSEIFLVMTKYNIEPKTMRFIYPKIHKPPSMVMIEGVKNGKPDLINLPPLIMYNEDGTYTDEIKKIYYE